MAVQRSVKSREEETQCCESLLAINNFKFWPVDRVSSSIDADNGAEEITVIIFDEVVKQGFPFSGAPRVFALVFRNFQKSPWNPGQRPVIPDIC